MADRKTLDELTLMDENAILPVNHRYQYTDTWNGIRELEEVFCDFYLQL